MVDYPKSIMFLGLRIYGLCNTVFWTCPGSLQCTFSIITKKVDFFSSLKEVQEAFCVHYCDLYDALE
mgnify:CR=1 FL=1